MEHRGMALRLVKTTHNNMFAASKSGSVSEPTDSKFNYVTMLLHGNGTNGAQNNTFLDSSTNNFTITRNGNTTQGTFTPYGSNWSNYFDGSGDYLTLPSNSCVVGANDFTLEAWVFIPDRSADYTIFNSQTNATTAAGSSYGLEINTAGVMYSYYYVGSTTYNITSTGTVPTNTWNHVVLARTGGTISLFINGVRDGTRSDLSTSTINAGATNYPPGIGINAIYTPFKGYISNFRLLVGSGGYNATSSTITVPTTPLTAVTNTAVLTCADNRFIDDSTNNFTITRNGDTSVQRFSPFSPTTAYSTSVIGGSGYFDGSGDYLNIANQTALHLGGGDFSIECWTYLTSTSGAQRPISQNNSDYEFAFYIANGGDITVYSSQSSGSLNFSINGGTLVTGQWYHLACTRTGSTIAFFVNGVRKNTATFSGTVDSQTGGWRIGANGVGTDLQKGYITDARLVFGSNPYGVGTTLTLPTAPLTAVTNTQLLCNFTNAGILDNAMMNDLETVGNAQISTSVKKYGTGSMYFDGSGDWLNASSSPNYGYGSGDFTIEFWVYPTSSSGIQVLLDQRTGSSTSAVPTIYTSSGTIYYYVSGNNRITGGSLSLNQWSHISICRSGTSTKLFINGTQSGSTFTDTTTYLNAPVRIGDGNDGAGPYPYSGYIDDLRITKGFARYTSNFTAPTAAFPDKG
jgi:hypothetical protein